jgi:hypothetical protein
MRRPTRATNNLGTPSTFPLITFDKCAFEILKYSAANPSVSTVEHSFVLTIAIRLTIALPFWATRAINRHARSKRRKGYEDDMTNEETNTAAAVAEQGAHVAPQKGTSKKVPSKKKGAPKGQKTAKGAKPKRTAKTESKAAAPRAESKGAQILALIRRPKGATLAELANVTGWQNHSIRGFLSGTVGKKMGLAVESTRREDGARVYSIKK